VKKFINFALLTLPCQDSAGLGECISGIYSWSLAVVGIVAFVQIVYAGWLYLTAAGNTSKAGAAMSKISNAILGIILLFSSYLILNTINPDLVGGGISLPNLKGDKVTPVDYGNGISPTYPDTSLPPGGNGNQNFTLIKGGVFDNNGKVLANVSVFDDSRSFNAEGIEPIKEPPPGTPLIFGAFTSTSDISPASDWVMCVEGAGFGPKVTAEISNLGNFPITLTSANSGFFTIPNETFIGIAERCGSYGSSCYLTSDPWNPHETRPTVHPDGSYEFTTSGYLVTAGGFSQSDFFYVNIDSARAGQEQVPECGKTKGARYLATAGKGTLKIGKTDSQGEIIFDQQFIDFLKDSLGSGNVSVSADKKTISLPKNITSISGGLTARYEISPTSKIKRNITYNNGAFDLSTNLKGEVPTTTTSSK